MKLVSQLIQSLVFSIKYKTPISAFRLAKLPDTIHQRLFYRCDVCKINSSQIISKHSLNKGVVIIKCPSCSSLHLIKDNLDWTGIKKN